MQLYPNQPIGIFDSGVGGLTVANAIQHLLPGEQMLYYGDTVHLPYGDKSVESVQHYSTRIADFLVNHNCKLILIACNTASALAYDAVLKSINNKALVVNVIDPVIQSVALNKSCKTIGVIGTKGTINSGTYKTKLTQSIPNIDVKLLATPLLVPMIEEGFIFDDISNAIIRNYLSKDEIQGIDTLILGCTHYPIIKNQISKFFNFKVNVLDSAMIVANQVRHILQDNNLLNTTNEPKKHSFWVSDYTDYFESISKLFFEENIKLEKIDIWQ